MSIDVSIGVSIDVSIGVSINVSIVGIVWCSL